MKKQNLILLSRLKKMIREELKKEITKVPSDKKIEILPKQNVDNYELIEILNEIEMHLKEKHGDYFIVSIVPK
jgi:ribonuclease HII